MENSKQDLVTETSKLIPAPQADKANASLTLSDKEAEEYCAYKRQKKVSSIMSAIARSASELDGKEDAQKMCDRALRLHQASVRMSPLFLAQYGDNFVRRGVMMDCVIGGNGDTLPRVKAYEAKLALRLRARELTLKISPSQVAACRYAEIRKEIRRIRRLSKKMLLKVSLDGTGAAATVSRIARICSESGVDYFSIPYFAGCERLKAELSGGCKLEVSGVQTLADFKKLTEAGAGRIITNKISEIYTGWMREADEITLLSLKEKTTENKLLPEENRSARKTEVSDLKFL